MSINLNDLKKERKTKKINSKLLKSNFNNKLSDKKKEVFYRELAILLNSGVDFKKALEIISIQSSTKIEKDIYLSIKEKIVHGKSIYEALMTSGQFSAYEYYSVQIGEETRKLEIILMELQKYFHRKIQMKRQIISVLTYPAIVLIVTFSVLYFMLNKVVPMFSSVFKQFGSELPKITKIILEISSYSGAIFFGIFFFIITSFTIHYFMKEKVFYRSITSTIILRTPYFGKLIQKIYLARFCQSMNLLISSKTTLLNSLSLTSKMIRFYPLESSIEIIKFDVTKGISLSDSMKKHAIYENKMVSMIEVAEQINQLDSMFERLSEQYNEEINHQTNMIGVVIEPLIIIFIGIIVGVIMISMYAPMFDLSKIIRN